MESDQVILDYYNSLASTYDSNRFHNSYGQFIHRQELAFLERSLDRSKKPVLDIGCGTGRFLAFADHGIDISPEMIRVASAKHPGKKLLVADGEKIPFDNNLFRQAFCLHVIMHLTKEKTAGLLEEAARVIQQQGKLIIDFPSAKRRKLGGYKSAGWHGANDYSLQQLKELTDKNWKIKTCEGILFIPVHRFPVFLRSSLSAIDSLLCRSFLKEYSSYLIVVLEKR